MQSQKLSTVAALTATHLVVSIGDATCVTFLCYVYTVIHEGFRNNLFIELMTFILRKYRLIVSFHWEQFI
jgi:hypothetical protein